MANQIQPLNVPLDEVRRILERRQKASLELAARSTTPRLGQASRDEAAVFAGLRLLVDELELARTCIHGDPSRPVSRSDAAMVGRTSSELSPTGVDQLLSEVQSLPDEALPRVAALD